MILGDGGSPRLNLSRPTKGSTTLRATWGPNSTATSGRDVDHMYMQGWAHQQRARASQAQYESADTASSGKSLPQLLITTRVFMGPVAHMPLGPLAYVLKIHGDAPGLHDGCTILRTHPEARPLMLTGVSFKILIINCTSGCFHLLHQRGHSNLTLLPASRTGCATFTHALMN